MRIMLENVTAAMVGFFLANSHIGHINGKNV